MFCIAFISEKKKVKIKLNIECGKNISQEKWN